MDYSIDLSYKIGDKAVELSGLKNDDLEITVKETDGKLTAVINARHEITNVAVNLRMPYVYDIKDRVYCNGFQSWSTSREYSSTDKMKNGNALSRAVVKKIGANFVGDYDFTEYSNKAGNFHSISLSYVKKLLDTKIFLIGSLDERYGYTVIYHDMHDNIMRITKDLEGVKISGEYPLFTLGFYSGEYDEVFDKYFADTGIKKPRVNHAAGYNSWYYYFQKIDETVIRRDLNNIAEYGDKIDYFTIDDGYETAVGDWLKPDEQKFPSGMKAMADAIHEKGYGAGLWLCPFGATPKSELYAAHPDWFIKNSEGKPIVVGPAWKGFYSLDIYNGEVREHLKKVFDIVINEWGYDLLKLDFLYCCACVPREGKSRAEIMSDGMDLIRELAGDKVILACGVPVSIAYGKADYCRVGADVSFSWCAKLESSMPREMVSTRNAITSTVFRRYLNGRAFASDPDVAIFRSINQNMSLTQRKLLGRINKLFGALRSVSDNVGLYKDSHRTCFTDFIADDNIKIENVDVLYQSVLRIAYRENGAGKELVFNLKNGEIIKAAPLA